MENIVRTVGLDLAKNSFHVHCADADGHCLETMSLRRNQVLPYFEKLPRCTVAMDTCTGTKWWCRQLKEQGHDARLIPAKFVKPFVKSQKNDALDVEAICEAAQRPNMRYAPLKSEDASAVLTLHRTRQRLVKRRTMTINAVRAACMEFGKIAPLTTKGFASLVSSLLDDGDELPASLKTSQRPMLELIDRLNETISELKGHIVEWHKSSDASQRLATIPGVGVLSASYLAAVLGDGSAYKNGRQFAASLGLVPKQWSTGGRQTLGGITKSGDGHLRGLLFEGAMAVINSQMRYEAKTFPITRQRVLEKSRRAVSVAMANRNARCAWALIAHGTTYEVAYEG